MLDRWKVIGCMCQWLVNNANAEENEKCINYDYAFGDKVLIISEGKDHKAKDKHIGHFPMFQVYTNGMVKIQHGHTNGHINIWRLTPYFGWKEWHPLLEALSQYLDEGA